MYGNQSEAGMRTSVCIWLVFVVSSFTADDSATAAESAMSVSAADALYRAPRDRPAPRRIGGSSRGVSPSLPIIAVLVPDHLGLTRSEQPRLYWFISAPTDIPIEATLIQPGRDVPLVELLLPGSAAGIHALDLRQLGVRLQPGVEYEWSIALVAHPAQRSRDIVSGGAIMHIQTSANLATDAEEYARRGLWYDALMALERNLGEQAAAARARSQRAALLEQAGLLEVAAFERR
jgi:hypothetical protein